ncbi:hypothetical protein [Sphingopyxis fribergensis]
MPGPKASFIKLLNHGTRRTSAKKRLTEDPTSRYLLVTSASLNYPINKIGVRSPGSWPQQGKTPVKLAGEGDHIARRVAIIGGKDDDALKYRIKDLLIDRFRVPGARWEECLGKLRKAA